MDLNTIVPIGLKPTVAAQSWEEYKQFDLPGRGNCLLSWYFCEAQVQRMIRMQDGEILWSGEWAWLTKQEAMNCARAEAFKDGITEGRNLFFEIEDSAANLRQVMNHNPEAERTSQAMDSVIERHIDDGDNSLIAHFDPHNGELKKYRVCDHYLLWWYTFRPLTRENARTAIAKTLEDYDISPEDLEYIEVLHPKKVG